MAKKQFQQLERGTYAITVIHEDCVRVDLLDECIPAKIGELEDGWGSCFLSTSQLLEFIKDLTQAMVRSKAVQTPVRKLGRPK